MFDCVFNISHSLELVNGIGDDGVKHLADMLTVNKTLTLLNLSGESIVFYFCLLCVKHIL